MSVLLDRISIDPNVCFGKPCIRGTRVTVVGLVAAGHTSEEILREHPYVEAVDIGRSPVLFGVACRGG